ncbi:MAG: ABC transporter permease, partial [Thermoanaerobaculia bacterium]|nr:ABC transporter permease [Thermoanaerobaculia bacterium]
AREIERRNGIRPRLIPLHERISGDTRSSVFLLGGAVAVLMLIVCANLSNLLLARATTRRKEMAIHMAMGAGRGRLTRKLLLESLLLSGLGTAFGVLLTFLGARWLSRVEGVGIPLLHQVQIDLWVLLFAGALATLVGVLFGVFPALQASNTAPAEAMRGESRATGSEASSRTRQVLVFSEIALACVLLVGVGLFLRSLLAALSTELGFDTQNVVALRVDLPRGFLEPEERLARYDELLAAAHGVPQVASAGVTDALPLGDNFGWRTWDARAAEWSEEQEGIETLVRLVDGGYWNTLGLKLLAGRYLQDTDRSVASEEEQDAPPADRAVVVNETLAKLLWPQADSHRVVSRRLVTSGRSFRVVGVVSEARYFNLEQASGPEMYFSARQVADANSLDLVMRTRGAPETALPAIRSALRSVAPELPLDEFRTMEGLLDQATFRRRAVLGLLAGFGGFGLLLAVLGVYSVIAYLVAQNRRELGIRMAFGATRDRLCRELVRRTLKPVLVGAAGGLICALGLAKVVASQLYGVSPTDPLTFAAVASILLARSHPETPPFAR